MRATSILSVLSFTLFGTPLATAAVISGPIVNPKNDHTCSHLTQNTRTGSEAEAVSLGGHLVTINDADEPEWVYSAFTANPVIQDRFDNL